MELQMLKEKEMPLLARRRVEYSIQSENATPSRMTLKKEISKLQKVKEDQVIIRHVYGKYGTTSSKVIAHIYKDTALLGKLENKNCLY